ncbi:hypothetical protein PanWU01x14_041610 [Parasponia andersonii]|uniref:Uncharacterized protein n=1 Tax=Parasponia andersonii TaxID=3476 RepID=A0A2P5DQH6_PARAD|nr:hypothetical protein PanWU01x14_041610 [Parasponia andersonii]
MPTPTAKISTLRNLSSPISKGLLPISPLILLSRFSSLCFSFEFRMLPFFDTQNRLYI